MVIQQHDRRFVADRTMRAALWRFVAQLQAQLTILRRVLFWPWQP
jgi:hypothetical protein